jgi:hypothetical protein
MYMISKNQIEVTFPVSISTVAESNINMRNMIIFQNKLLKVMKKISTSCSVSSSKRNCEENLTFHGMLTS